MKFNDWLKTNNEDLMDITKNIVKDDKEYMEVYQHVILQLLEKPQKIDEVPDNQKRYFFIKVLRNNWFSSTSPYHYQRRKHQQQHVELKDKHYVNIEDEGYKENLPSIEWVKEQLNDMSWFERDLWLFYFENKTYIEVHRKTNIPINSVSRYIRKTNEELINRYKKEKK